MEKRQCGICGGNVSLIQVKGKRLCQECLIIGTEKVTILWKNSLEGLWKEYTDFCFRCLSTGDPEDVHQARIAGRKIRAILEFLGVSKKHELFLTIKRMHHLLNKVREADVLLEALKADRDNNKVKTEMKRLVRKKRKELQELLEIEIPTILNDTFDKKVKIFIRKELSAYTVPLVKDQVIREYEEHFQCLVENYHQTVKDKGKTSSDSIKALHAVRIQSKTLRYIYHYANQIFEENYHDQVKYYKHIQNQFGDINDLQDWLNQLKKYEKKLDVSKSEMNHVKKQLKNRLHDLIENIHI